MRRSRPERSACRPASSTRPACTPMPTSCAAARHRRDQTRRAVRTHMRNEADGLFEALDEAVSTIRAAADAGADTARLQVSHLKCGVAVGPRAGRGGRRRVGGCPQRRSRRGRRPVPVYRRRDDPGHDPAAGIARARDRRVPRGVERPRCPRPRDGRDRARHLGLGERRPRPRLGRHPDLLRGEPSRLVGPIAGRRSATRSGRILPISRSTRWWTIGSTSRS